MHSLILACSRIVAITVPMQERLQVRQALQALLAQLPADTLAARCVRPLQRYIDSCVAAGLGATRLQVGPGWCLRPVRFPAQTPSGLAARDGAR